MVYNSNPAHHWLYGAAALILSLIASSTNAMAKDGQDVYNETCLLCHGVITEKSSWYRYLPADGSKVDLAVITPRGPTLNGIVGRPVAIIPNYAYSKAMRKFGETGAIWDRKTLDVYLTNSRKFVKGTFMILKLEKEDRNKVLDFLESFAVYQQ